jgi:catechol 2,3-dioxygenase-like lactoylglutathione lyase family enzyme
MGWGTQLPSEKVHAVPMHGIHHVTAIAGRPRVNIEFYAGTLGLRFVKKTVNFDDPGTCHFSTTATKQAAPAPY